MFGRKTHEIPGPDVALAGRATPIVEPGTHHELGTPMVGPWPEGHQTAVFAMGCFWGAERIFWRMDGVHTTAAGYTGGHTPNPTYEEVCSGRTGHAEAVLVVFDPERVAYSALLKAFWENHDPTQGMRQGNDRGTQYRSAIFTAGEAQQAEAEASRDRYQQALKEEGYGEITTEIAPAGQFYYAEDAHQQYLAKHPGGYCNHGFCQVAYGDEVDAPRG